MILQFNSGFAKSFPSSLIDMEIQHKELAEGRWFTLSLAEQMGNIGGEVHRAVLAEAQNPRDAEAAFIRALELIDLTLADKKLRGRRKEITRLREILCDTVTGSKTYQTNLEDLDRYLMPFAIAARLQK